MSLTQASRALFRNDIRGHCVSIYLLVVFIAGVYLRIDELSGLGFGWDDTMHIHLRSSPLKTLAAIVRDSYRDAHPPFRNIVLHLLTQVSMTPMVLRSVAYAPGILLMPLVHLWLSRIFNSRLAGAVGLTAIAFGHEYIILSKGTRPYMLFACFMVGFLWNWYEYLRDPKGRWLVTSGICGIAASATHYAAVTLILPALIVGLVKICWDRRFNFTMRLAWISTNTLPLILLIVQFVLIKHFHADLPSRLSQRGRFIGSLTPLQDIGVLVEAFNNLYFNSLFAPDLLFYLWIAGLIFLLLNRQLVLFSVCCLMVLTNIGLHRAGYYPFVPSRHILPILITGLIPISFAFFCLFKRSKTTRSIFALRTCLIFGTLFSLRSAPVFHTPINQFVLDATSDFEFTNPRPAALRDYIRSHLQPGDQIITSWRLLRFLETNQVNLSSWLQDLPKNCYVPSSIAFAQAHYNLPPSHVPATATVSSYLKDKCYDGIEPIRYWCVYCESALGLEELQTVNIEGNSLLLF